MKSKAGFLWQRIFLLLAAASGCGGTGDGVNDCGAVALTACDTGCVDLAADASNCGACGLVCSSGETCSQGACATGSSGVGGSTAGVGGGVSIGGTSSGGMSSSGGAWTSGGSDGSGGETTSGGSSSGGAFATGGSSSGGAASGGAAGTGGSNGSDCGVSPVNPNATTQARKLLCYLYDIYGEKVLSGQQETSWSNPEGDISWYTSNVGKAPAVMGGDYLYPSGTSTRAIAYWNAGGITMIRYHMGAPPNSDTYENSMGTANIANVLQNGTSEHASWVSKLDYAAAELQKLENANVAVLWAPYHEVQPGGWFWWSKGTASQFKQIWTFTYNYLTTTKGLDNLVWLMPFSGSPNSDWYPAKQYLDISGPDTYGTNPPFTSLYNSAKNVIGSTIPIPLHETGTVPQPSTMFPSSAPWVLFSVWAGYQTSHNTLSNMQSAYSSSYTITRDEVPNLK